MNEAGGFRSSNLTREQRQDAMEDLYGIRKDDMSPENFSFEDRARMRRVLDALDAKEAGGMKEFDLNKPPLPPYVYQEYPILLYNHETGKNRPARNHEEREQMLASGWSESPVPPPPTPEIPLSMAERQEAEEIDRALIKKGPRK